MIPSATGREFLLRGPETWDLELSAFSIAVVLTMALIYLWKARPARQYARAEGEIAEMLTIKGADQLSARIGLLYKEFEPIAATRGLIAANRARLAARLDLLLERESAARDEAVRTARQTKLKAEFDAVLTRCSGRIQDLRQNSPAIKADKLLAGALASLKQQKAALQIRWQQQHEKLSWWGKLNHEEPDLAAIDRKVTETTRAQNRLKASGDIAKTQTFFDDLMERARLRVFTARSAAEVSVPQSHQEPYDPTRIAQNALMLSAMSVPVSAWSDITQAADIYDTLREVNGNYTEMGNLEIWLATLMMPSESLAGLASLTKGAYFEKLVEANTGGMRFEHFNHPDTDIVIDGTAYQIKATDSANYIGTVDENIPVIATSEVADVTRAIDGGYTNAEVEGSVDLALGGSIVDISDTAVDAVLTGLGGLGFLATIKGINYAAGRYRENPDVVLALADGIEVAVAGTAKAAVDTLELGYKAITSRPSRFVGRMLLKAGTGVVNAVDRKIEGK